MSGQTSDLAAEIGTRENGAAGIRMRPGGDLMTAFARLLPVLFFSFLLAAPVAVARPSAPDPMDASLWEIGPVTPTRNYSVNMPLTPSPHADGWYFDFPQPNK